MTQLVSIEAHGRSAEVRQDIVSTLEDWLEDAKAGRLVGLALCGVNIDKTTRSQVCESDNYHMLLASVTVLQFRLLSESAERSEDG